MIGKKTPCPWWKCQIGFKYHHTGEEWDQHVGYAKLDIPKLQEELSPGYTDVQGGSSSAVPTVQVSRTVGKWDNFFRYTAVGTMLAVWGIVVFTAVRFFT